MQKEFMIITIILIFVSIIWLWIGTRFYFLRSGVNFNITDKDNDLEESLSRKRLERKAKLFATIVLGLIAFWVYHYQDESFVAAYVLIVGWLLFYLMNEEISLIYRRIGKLRDMDRDDKQYVMNSIQELEDRIEK